MRAYSLPSRYTARRSARSVALHALTRQQEDGVTRTRICSVRGERRSRQRAAVPNAAKQVHVGMRKWPKQHISA